MGMNWDQNISSFIQRANQQEVRMIMVGSCASNFYGYNGESSAVDFWVEATSENLKKIMAVLKELGPELTDLPIPIANSKQNISIKFSPTSSPLELITHFVIDKSFTWAYEDSRETSLEEDSTVKWRVLALEDLIVSKTYSFEPKDLIELQELRRISKSEA